jgi:hypothetical protein
VGVGFTSREKCWIFASVLVSLEAVLSLIASHSYLLTAFGDLTQCLLLLFVLLAMLGNVSAAGTALPALLGTDDAGLRYVAVRTDFVDVL